jgi:hypothetical protein
MKIQYIYPEPKKLIMIIERTNIFWKNIIAIKNIIH